MASAQGTIEIDFGAFPGGSDATIAVPSPSIGATSLPEAWIYPKDTADHTADEHIAESLGQPRAHSVVAGVGFSITMCNASQINEPLVPFKGVTDGLAGGLSAPQGDQQPTRGGIGTRIYGKWTLGWCWSDP